MFPIHLNLGFSIFYFYEGFYFFAAILIAFIWSRKRVARENINANEFDSIAFAVIIGGIIGGRLSSLLIYSLDRVIANPVSIFYVWEGGISIIGALPVGLLAGWLYCKKKKINLLKIVNIIVPPVLLAQAVGRIGCFLNGDGHGIASNVPWAVRVPKYGRYFPSFQTAIERTSPGWQYSLSNNFIDKSSQLSAPLHPAALYESLGLFVLFFITWFISKKIKNDSHIKRYLVLIHLGGYSLVRVIVEFFRADREAIVSIGLSILQMILIIAFLISVLGYFITAHFYNKKDSLNL